MARKAIVIGSGIGGLGTACLLAKDGYAVTVLEKNAQLGGRAGVIEEAGYRFDKGPSWYLMPDVFAHFFSLLGERVEDHLKLAKLSPSYRIYFKESGRMVDVEADVEKAAALFDTLEPGAGAAFRRYLDSSAYQYGIATREFMYKNYDSPLDFLNKRTMIEGRKLSVLSSMDAYVNKHFSSDLVRKIMQYQLVFLGSSPYKTPALYNIMAHVDFNMGVFYPEGGIRAIPEALACIAAAAGADLRTRAEVSRILVEDSRATGVELATGERLDADLVVSNADIAHTELALLPERARERTPRYWKKRTLAPSAFILYLGVDGPIDSLAHHTLLFSEDWKRNFAQMFDTPGLPDDPSLYVCRPSATDPTVAPAGKENLFVLVPIGAGVDYAPEALAAYREQIIDTLQEHMGVANLRDRIEFERMYGPDDFRADYHSLGGSALGLAHTLGQTATLRPNNVSTKVRDLYYVGANTNPGIGMPTCLISAELAYKRIAGIRSPGPIDGVIGGPR